MRLVLALSAAFWASTAFGDLVLDGNVGTGEYAHFFNDVGDPTSDLYVGTGLDMTAIYSSYDIANGKVWLGLTTAQAILTSGDPTSIEGATLFACDLSDGATPVYRLHVTLTDPMTDSFLELWHWDGSAWVASSTAGMDFKANTGLEIVAPASLLPALTPNFHFDALLNGTGTWQDDQMSGQLPEPASMLLLAAALPMLLRRRR